MAVRFGRSSPDGDGCSRRKRAIQPPLRSRTNAEQRTAKAFEAARANPLDLRAFLVGMPKGADLHVHLSGAVYAESWIRAGAEDHLCVNLSSLSFAKPDFRGLWQRRCSR